MRACAGKQANSLSVYAVNIPCIRFGTVHSICWNIILRPGLSVHENSVRQTESRKAARQGRNQPKNADTNITPVAAQRRGPFFSLHSAAALLPQFRSPHPSRASAKHSFHLFEQKKKKWPQIKGCSFVSGETRQPVLECVA